MGCDRIYELVWYSHMVLDLRFDYYLGNHSTSMRLFYRVESDGWIYLIMQFLGGVEIKTPTGVRWQPPTRLHEVTK